MLAAGREVSVFFFNPNIYPQSEFEKRLGEQRRLLAELSERVLRSDSSAAPIELIAPEYDHAAFLDVARGLEAEPEEGERCRRCFSLRMDAAARLAAERDFDAVTSTITTGPRKRSADVNAAGQAAAERHGVAWFAEDFKKRDGFKRSIELSREFALYRQTYCGCEFSFRVAK